MKKYQIQVQTNPSWQSIGDENYFYDDYEDVRKEMISICEDSPSEDGVYRIATFIQGESEEVMSKMLKEALELEIAYDEDKARIEAYKLVLSDYMLKKDFDNYISKL